MLNANRKLVSFDKLETGIRQKMTRAFQYGFEDAVMRIDSPKPFYAVLFEDEGVTYLVKLNKYQIKAASIEYDDDDEDDVDISSDSIGDEDDD